MMSLTAQARMLSGAASLRWLLWMLLLGLAGNFWESIAQQLPEADKVGEQVLHESWLCLGAYSIDLQSHTWLTETVCLGACDTRSKSVRCGT